MLVISFLAHPSVYAFHCIPAFHLGHVHLFNYASLWIMLVNCMFHAHLAVLLAILFMLVILFLLAVCFILIACSIPAIWFLLTIWFVLVSPFMSVVWFVFVILFVLVIWFVLDNIIPFAFAACIIMLTIYIIFVKSFMLVIGLMQFIPFMLVLLPIPAIHSACCFIPVSHLIYDFTSVMLFFPCLLSCFPPYPCSTFLHACYLLHYICHSIHACHYFQSCLSSHSCLSSPFHANQLIQSLSFDQYLSLLHAFHHTYSPITHPRLLFIYSCLSFIHSHHFHPPCFDSHSLSLLASCFYHHTLFSGF